MRDIKQVTGLEIGPSREQSEFRGRDVVQRRTLRSFRFRDDAFASLRREEESSCRAREIPEMNRANEFHRFCGALTFKSARALAH